MSPLNCCTVHSAVGFAVTSTSFSRRVPCSITTNTYSMRNVTVTVTKQSHANIALAWGFWAISGAQRRSSGSDVFSKFLILIEAGSGIEPLWALQAAAV